MSASKYNWAVVMHAGTRPQRYLKILDVVYTVTKFLMLFTQSQSS